MWKMARDLLARHSELVDVVYWLVHHSIIRNRPHFDGMAKIAAISSITGGCAWVVSFPFDTVKSVMQAQAPSKPCVSLSETICSLYYNNGLGASTVQPSGGFAAFYRGCAASTGRAVLVTSSRMMTYEFVARTFFSTN